MPVTIQVNGKTLTLVHKFSNGISTATVPDVCKTPSPAGPVPIPYPNIAQSITLSDGTTTVKGDKAMAANKGSKFAMSNGDQAGTVGGVKSNVFMKEATWILYSFDVKLQSKNACRLTDPMYHNSQNTVNMAGVVQPCAALVAALGQADADAVCKEVCANYVPNKLNPNAAKAVRPASGTQAGLDANGIGVGEQTQWLPSAGKGGFAPVITAAGTVAKSSSGCGAGNTVRWDRNINGKWVELKGDKEKFTKGQLKAMQQGQKPTVVRPKDCGCPQP